MRAGQPADLGEQGVTVLGMLATLTLLTPAVNLLLPIGRFGGLAWLLVASVLLPAGRQMATTPKDRS